MSGFDRLHPGLQHHIVNSLGWGDLRPLQAQALDPLLDGEHALLLAPTAGGKTEAAFFPVLSRMLTEPWNGLSVLYVCPLRALLNNIEPRLRSYCQWVGRSAALWHGDVGTAERRRIVADPPDCLLVTPESLEVMLITRREHRAELFGDLRVVVIDEMHAFAGDDRGWHLMSILERLSRVAGREIQRVGLSATIGNPERLLEWMAGHCEGRRRVIGVGGAEVTPEVTLDYVGSLHNAAQVIARLHSGEKRLIFCDSRARVEELAQQLRELGVTTLVSHGSLGVDERRRAEEAFSTATNCVIVATSTLELGLDVGDLDRVIQIDAPSSVASFLQRLGRTGRRVGAARNCLFLATGDDAFLQACGLLELWRSGYVEPVEPPPSPLHIFAQQLMALSLQEGGIARGDWRTWLGRMSAFATTSREELEAVLAYMLERQILWEEEGVIWLGEALSGFVLCLHGTAPVRGPLRPQGPRVRAPIVFRGPFDGGSPSPLACRPELGRDPRGLAISDRVRGAGPGRGPLSLAGVWPRPQLRDVPRHPTSSAPRRRERASSPLESRRDAPCGDP